MDNITSSKLICVEGKDEVNFFTSLFSFLEISGVQILDFNGKSNFRAKIKALKLTRGFDIVTKLALIRDADEHPPESAFTSLSSILSSANLASPPNNQEFSDSLPSVGIFIMPGDDNTGALEDLCLRSIAEEESYSCIEEFFECVDTELSHISKAKVLCYLASKEPYSNSLGRGAQKGHWDFSNDSFQSLIDFLEELK